MIRYLEHFIAVAEELNFTKAAERLNISQPPLSRQIRLLEKEVGATLFLRSNQGTELTYAGKVLLEKAYAITNLIQKASQETLIAHKGEYGELKIGFTASMTIFLTPIFQKFSKKYPDVLLSLYELTTANQLTGFEEGKIDIGFVCPPIPERNLELIPIMKQPFVVAIPTNHKLANAANSINLHDLKDDNFILVPKTINHDPYVDLIMNIFNECNFFPKNYVNAHVSNSVISLVAEGMGVAIIPKSVAKMKMKGVTYKNIQHTNTFIHFALARKKNKISNIIENFIRFLESNLDNK